MEDTCSFRATKPSGQIDPSSQHSVGDKADILDENKLMLQGARDTDGNVCILKNPHAEALTPSAAAFEDGASK